VPHPSDPFQIPSDYFHGEPPEDLSAEMRPVGAGDVVRAQDAATKASEGANQHSANDIYMAELIAVSCHDEEGAPKFMGGDHALNSLRPAGVRFLFERLEALEASVSPLAWAATEEDIADMSRALAAAPPDARARALRVIGYALGILDDATPPDAPAAQLATRFTGASALVRRVGRLCKRVR
jgi:hypothetical protein